MRDLIKILIALAFIAGSFFVGKYIADEKCSTQLKEVNSKTETDKRLIQQLNDSISTLKADLENEKAKSKIDTIKPSLKHK
jgi:hypothetical protein